MFYAKEEKANFKLENVRHFLTDIYIYIYKTRNRKPYVNIISENNIGATQKLKHKTSTYI